MSPCVPDQIGIKILEVLINGVIKPTRLLFGSVGFWPAPSYTWVFPLSILVLYQELTSWPLSLLNQISPPSLLSPPQMSLFEINKPPGGLIKD